MSRGEHLAKEFEKANGELISLVEGLTEEQWLKPTPAEGWPAGVAAYHIGESHTGVSAMVQGLASGAWQPPPFTQEMLDQANAQRNTGCTKEQTLDLLRKNGSTAAAMLRGLKDDQLDHKGYLPLLGQDLSAQEVAQNILIGHVTQQGEAFAKPSGQRSIF